MAFIDTRYKEILLDGYNVLLSVDRLLKKKPIWLYDNDYVRDTRCYFSKAKQVEDLEESLDLVIKFLCEAHPKSFIFYWMLRSAGAGNLQVSFATKWKNMELQVRLESQKPPILNLKHMKNVRKMTELWQLLMEL